MPGADADLSLSISLGAMLQASPTAMWMAFTRVGCFHRAQSASALSRAAAAAETFFGYLKVKFGEIWKYTLRREVTISEVHRNTLHTISFSTYSDGRTAVPECLCLCSLKPYIADPRPTV